MKLSKVWMVCTLVGLAVWNIQVVPASALSFPEKDQELQPALEDALAKRPYGRLLARNQLSVVLVDLTDPSQLRYVGIHDDVMRYAASLPKIAILLTVFEKIDSGELSYGPELQTKLEEMIRRSSNRDSTELIKLVGFEAIAQSLLNPAYELYDPERGGGLWVGKDYGGGLGRWKRDPLHSVSHGATARQVARFFAMLELRMLVSDWASAEMKRIMGRPSNKHKFVRGLLKRPGSMIYRKSGTWKRWHADGALVQRDGKTYVAVALLEGNSANDILAGLILELDDLIHGSVQ